MKRRELVKKLESMHNNSWQSVQKFVEANFKTWSVSTAELGDQTVLPTLLPWLEATMNESSFNRAPEEEGYVLYMCMPTCGVVPTVKRNFFLQVATTFCATHRKNAVGILIFPNRAAENRTSKSERPVCNLSADYRGPIAAAPQPVTLFNIKNERVGLDALYKKHTASGFSNKTRNMVAVSSMHQAEVTCLTQLSVTVGLYLLQLGFFCEDNATSHLAPP